MPARDPQDGFDPLLRFGWHARRHGGHISERFVASQSPHGTHFHAGTGAKDPAQGRQHESKEQQQRGREEEHEGVPHGELDVVAGNSG